VYNLWITCEYSKIPVFAEESRHLRVFLVRASSSASATLCNKLLYSYACCAKSNLLVLRTSPWNFGILEFALYSQEIFFKKEYYLIYIYYI
jgi:hypothetical protein